MKHMMTIFKQYKEEIRNYIFDSINAIEKKPVSKEDLEYFFPIFSSLESVYMVDEECHQITPFYYKESEVIEKGDKNLSTLRENLKLDEKGEYMSSVYLSSDDGNATVTVSKKIANNELIIMNFNLARLIEELKLDSSGHFFNAMSRFIYGAIGYSLTLFSLILIVYSIYNFVNHFIAGDVNIFQSIFKSTIALTLGLAIFDLAKNLLEHEVIHKEYFSESHGSHKLLEKFLISIIIALSIEALMTVFKIALHDYTDIIYAVYLIVAVSVMIISLSFFRNYKQG